jgi:hypothetical protein
MFQDAQNLTMRSWKVGFFADSFENSIDILEAKNNMEPEILLLQIPIQWLMVANVWFVLLFGSFFKFIVYEYLYEQYNKKKFTPVGMLTLVLALSQHVNSVMESIVTMLIIFSGDSFGQIDRAVGGNWFCTVLIYAYKFNLYYSCIGSLGLSVYRILLIKHHHFLKNVIGEKVFLNIILYGGLLITTACTFIASSTDYDKLINDTCMIGPKFNILQLLDEYEQSRGNVAILPYFVNAQIVVVFIMIFAMISELLIYIMFFHYMYQHDNKEILRKLLDQNVIKLRNRANAITFFGQFCSFMLEITVLVLFIIFFATESSIAIAIEFKRMSFVLIGVVEVLTSNVLRLRMFNKLNHILDRICSGLYNLIFGLN